MQGKGISFIVLLVIIAFLTLTVTGLVVYIFVFSGGQNALPVDNTAVSGTEGNEVPNISELAEKVLFEERFFNLKSDNNNYIPLIQLTVVLQYFKGKDPEATEEKINAYESQINEMIGTYFQGLTFDEVKLQETKEKVKKDLVKMINKLVTQNDKVKKDIVYSITFPKWFYVYQ